MTTAEATELMLRYLEGEAGEGDVIRLQAALSSSPELVAVCAEISRQHLQLRELAEESAVAAPAPGLRVIAGGLSRPRFLRPAWVIAAAAAVIALAAILFRSLENAPRATVAAIVITSQDATPPPPGASWQSGTRLLLHTLNLRTGSVRLRLENGALITLTAPVTAEFLSPLLVRVRRGQLTADVSGGGKGLIVRAHDTEVMDLGTEFGVNVSDNGRADVVVFDGEVQLQKAAASGAKPWMNLNGGEAVRLDAARHATRIQAVYGEAGTNAWSLEASSDAETLVQSVSDNITLPDFQGYYRVMPRGMKPGAAPYGGKTPLWEAPEGKPFPAVLLDADVISTFQGKRFNPEFALTLALNHPATVFVMHDIRQPPPVWLQRDYSRTEAALSLPLRPGLLSAEVAATVPTDAQGRLFLTFSVWRRDVPAGTVILGESHASSERIPHFMYGLAVRAR